MKFNKFLNKETTLLIKKHNGSILAGDKSRNMSCIELCPTQINWSNKENQTRDSDLDKGHLSALSSDIASRGLKELPVVEYDDATELWNVVSGHHRTTAIKSLIAEEDIEVTVIPCAAVSFDNQIDRERFMQSENHHPPTKAHTRKDAIRFIKNMRNHGFFTDCNGDIDSLKKLTYELLEQYYCRLNSKRKEDVFTESFKDKEITRVLTALKANVQSQAEEYYKSTKSFSWVGNKYICWGDTNSSRKAIAVSLEKRVHDINNGKVKPTDPRGKLKVVVHFNSNNIDALKQSRQQFLKTEELMNRFAYLPGNLVMVDEIAFIPQIDGKSDIKENSLTVYKWNYELQTFSKI